MKNPNNVGHDNQPSILLTSDNKWTTHIRNERAAFPRSRFSSEKRPTRFVNQPLFLVRGKNQEKPAWWYVLVQGIKVVLFREKLKTGQLDLADYGDIVECGWGDDPPENVVKRMAEKYG